MREPERTAGGCCKPVVTSGSCCACGSGWCRCASGVTHGFEDWRHAGRGHWLFATTLPAGSDEDQPRARASMGEDLQRGQPTEVDHLNGEIVRLAGAQSSTLRSRALDGSGGERIEVELIHF